MVQGFWSLLQAGPAAGGCSRYRVAQSGNNHIQLYNTLTVLASSRLPPLGDLHSFATCLPCADRGSSYPVCLRNASKREPTRFGVALTVANRVFSIHIRPIHRPSERDGCSFFPAADGFNPEGFVFVHVSLPTNGKKPTYSHFSALTCHAPHESIQRILMRLLVRRPD